MLSLDHDVEPKRVAKRRSGFALAAQGRAWLWATLWASLGLSCSAQESSAPGHDPGTEGGPCHPDSSCADGLACLSHLCVRLGEAGAGGAAGSGGSECRNVGSTCTSTSDALSNCCPPLTCRDQRCCAPTASGCARPEDCCSSADRCDHAQCTPNAGGAAGEAGAAGASTDGGTAGAAGGSSCAKFPAECTGEGQCCAPYTCFQDSCCSTTGSGCLGDSECCMLQDYCDDGKCTPHCSAAGGACDFSIDCCQPMRCDQPNHVCMDAGG
jgi:hypothetical protein